MSQSQSRQSSMAPINLSNLAGNVPFFPQQPGDKLATSMPLGDFRSKRLLFNRLRRPGEVHVYSAECVAGERLHVQMLVPVLPLGGAVVPAFALVAQSLPYSADVKKLPFELPGGFSAVVSPPPTDLVQPVRDMSTNVRYYPGPAIDTRTLVGGRSYIVVWSPHNHLGKYVLQIGNHPNGKLSFWARFPAYWWQIRGWFGVSRAAAIYVTAAVGAVAATLTWIFRRD